MFATALLEPALAQLHARCAAQVTWPTRAARAETTSAGKQRQFHPPPLPPKAEQRDYTP